MNARQLQAYAIEQALAHQAEIAPELMEYVGGDSKSAIDASIQKAKAASTALVNRARAEMAQPPVGFTEAVREGIGDQEIPDVSEWSMAEYARHRSSLPGVGPKDLINFPGGSR
jgi:hypothetical protein